MTIQKGSTTLGSTKADGQGNLTFTPTDLTDGPHEFMALGEYKGNKAQAKLSLVIKSSTQTPTFEMNSEDIPLTQEERSDIFLIKNVTPTIHGKAEANTQVSVYNKKSTDDKGTRLDTVQVNSVGEWSYTFKDPQLAQGGNSIRVVAEDAAKNTADITKTIDLDSIPPTIEKIEIAQGSHISGRVANTKTPTFKITTEPDARIQLYLPGNTQPLDIRQSEKVADGKQAYYLTIPEYTFKNDGDHTIQVVATDKRGNSTERTEFNFEVDTVEVGDVEITLEDKTGDKASNFTDKELPKLLFKPTGKNITKIEIELKSSSGEKSQKHTLEKESLLRSWTPKEKLQIEGEYTVTATAYKGKTSGNPGSKKIHFYNTQPTIQTIELDRSDQGRDPKYTKNSKPTLLVKIDPKDASRAWKVEYDIKNNKGATVSSPPIETTNLRDSTYTVTPQTDWSHAEYTVIAKLFDKAGNSSTKTETFYFNDTPPNPSITFAEKTHVDKIKDEINDKQIIDNENKKFVIKNAKGGIALNEKDLIRVTLTKKMEFTNSSESFDNKNSEESGFSYDQSTKEWKFVPQTQWDNADYTLNVTVTNQYGSVGTSKGELTFTIVDDVQQPKIELLRSDNTAYGDVTGNITNKVPPKFFTDIDDNANKVILLIKDFSVKNDRKSVTFEGKTLDKLREPGYEYTSELGEKGKSKNYSLTVTTHVGTKNKASDTIELLIDNQLTTPKITLDPEKHPKVLGNTVSSTNPTFRLTDIDSDVREVKLTFSNKSPSITFYPNKELSEDLKKQGVSKKGKNDYTYTPQTDWSNGTYQITLTVKDQATNEKSYEYNVTIDTTAVETPEIILSSNDSFEQKKNITKSKNPNFKLKKIAENAQSEIQISVFSVNPKSSSTELGLKKITKTDAIQGFNLNSLTKDSKDVEIQNDGKYQIQAVVTSTAGSKSAPGSLDFTIDSADAPAPTIELVGNTGTNDKPVTNKTQPKLILKNIDSSRLDWDNPQLIKVTFLKKLGSNEDKKTQNFVQSQINIKESDDSTESEYELTWNKEDLTPGEYTVTAQVTYQAGQVGTGSLNNNNEMTIYTTPPKSTIKFLEELNLNKVDDQFKVSKSQMKFQIDLNEENVPPGEGTTSVAVILQNSEWKRETETYSLDGKWTADLSEPDQISKGGKYQVVAKVTDPHGNEGLSQPLSFELLDGLNPPVIKINAEDHTPYDQNEDPNIKITSKRTPQFTFDEIDDVVNKVTVSVSKSKEKNADPKTIKYTKIPEGKWKSDEDDQGYNSNQIPILFQEDGEYNMTLKAETTGGLEATSNRLTLGVYAGVMAPSIAVEGKDELEVLSGTATPTFEIKNVDPHAREIHITATPGKEVNTKKSFKAVLDKDGSIKTNPDNGFFKQIESGYQFIPGENLDEGKYNIVVSVINEARQPSSNSSPLGLIIDTSKPQQPSIVLSEASNTTHPDSLHEKWTSSRKPTFTIDLKDNNTDNPIEKVEVMVTGGAEYGIYIAKKDMNVWSTESHAKSSKKGTFSYMSNKLTFTPNDEWGKGEYSLSVKTYNSVDQPSDVSKTEVVNVNDDQPDQPKIELAHADQTGKKIDASNTNITNNPNPGFAISNINLEKDNIHENAVTISITKGSNSIISSTKVTYENGHFFYNTSNLQGSNGDGKYTATVRVTNKAGKPSTSDKFDFEIDTTAPNPPEIDWTSGSLVTTTVTDKNVPQKVANRERNFVFRVKIDKEIDDPKYITAKINNNLLTKPPKKIDKTEEGKNIWEFTSEALSKGTNSLSVEVKDKAGNTNRNSAESDFMVLNELPAPQIDMAHNTNAEGKTSTPYMINKVNMVNADTRKLNISLDDNKLFPYVEMKAELMTSAGSSAELSIKKNHPDNNWTVEIPERQADGKYTLKVTATDVLTMTKETEVDFEVDTTLTNIPVIELKNSGTKSSDSTDAQETTQTKPIFMIRNIPEDIYKINIQISGDNNDYEIKNMSDVKDNSKEWGGIKKDLEDDKKYSITVTFTDKAGNTSNNDNNLYKIKKIAPFVFNDPTLILDPETDSGTQGDFKTNHDKPVLLFKNTSDAKVTEGKLTLENKTANKSYTYPFKDFTPTGGPDSKEYKIDLIKNDSLTDKTAAFPAGEYGITVELTYDNNETYQKKTTLNDPLIINRHKPSAVSDVKYSFNETDGVKTINITGKKPENTDIFIQFDGQTEINIKKQSGASLFSDDTFSTTQPWGKQKNFTLFVKDEIGNQSENTQVDIPLPPNITKYKNLGRHLVIHIGNSDKKIKEGDKIIIKGKEKEKEKEKEKDIECTYTVAKKDLKNQNFTFETTWKNFTDKFTAYVKSKEGYESEEIQRTIPKPPEDVKYTFVGKGNYFVVKGDINTGERLNVKIKNGGTEITEKSRQANERDKIDTATKTLNKLKTLRTNPLEHNFTKKNFEVFSSNEEGGESQSVKGEIKDIVLYWDSTTGHYRARFSNYTNKDIGEYNPDPFVYPYKLKLGDFSLIEYKLLKPQPGQQYRVIEFDDSFLYELCRFIDYDIFKSIRYGNPGYDLGSIEWKFNEKNSEKVLAGNKKLEFVSLEDVLKFLTNDQTLDPEINTDKKNYLMNTLTQQFEIRPTKVKLKELEGDPYEFNSEVSGKTKAGQMGFFFVLDGKSNHIDSKTIHHNIEDGTFTLKVKNGPKHPNFYLYFKTTGTGNSITSFWLLIESGKSDDWDHANNNAEQFEKLKKLAEERLEGNNPAAPPSANNSEKNIDASQEENARSTEDQSSDASSSETTNQPAQPTESSPEESTTEEPSERSKRSTSLIEQEENPVDTGAQQVNLTQPQKQDIPPELVEEPKAAAPQNSIELLNPITSEENTTADLTPSFTLNAPKEAPDAVKALVTLDNRPEYALELIDNQGVFTVEMPLAEGPHELKVKFIDPDGDWIRLDKTFTIDASSERILSRLETPDRYEIDLSTGSKTIPSKENADMLMMTPVLHLPEHEEESTYYS